MKLRRRQFLRLAASAVSFPTFLHIARAQSYPSRPVRWIVPFAPGGFADIVVRPIAQHLTEKLRQPFVVENRPGAGSNIGTEAVVRAPLDGYTLLMVSQGNAVNATLYAKLNFNFIRDIAPVAGIVRVPLIMEVNPSFPAKTVTEFIAYAKANPGKLSFASGGNGTSTHLAAELFKAMTSVDMIHVPYRGNGPALTDLLGGQVQVMFDNMTTSLDHVRSGRLRGLAVTAATRSQALPDLPTVGDFVPGYEISAWTGVGVPQNTPAEFIDKLNKEINASLVDPKIKARLADLGGAMLAGSPADFGRLIANETEKWGKVIRAANIKPE